MMGDLFNANDILVIPADVVIIYCISYEIVPSHPC